MKYLFSTSLTRCYQNDNSYTFDLIDLSSFFLSRILRRLLLFACKINELREEFQGEFALVPVSLKNSTLSQRWKSANTSVHKWIFKATTRVFPRGVSSDGQSLRLGDTDLFRDTVSSNRILFTYDRQPCTVGNKILWFEILKSEKRGFLFIIANTWSFLIICLYWQRLLHLFK